MHAFVMLFYPYLYIFIFPVVHKELTKLSVIMSIIQLFTMKNIHTHALMHMQYVSFIVTKKYCTYNHLDLLTVQLSYEFFLFINYQWLVQV